MSEPNLPCDEDECLVCSEWPAESRPVLRLVALRWVPLGGVCEACLTVWANAFIVVEPTTRH
jgi:hypothetical protein